MEQQQKQQSFRGLQDNLKRSKIHVIGVSEEMERDWSTPAPTPKVGGEDFLNLMKDVNL